MCGRYFFSDLNMLKENSRKIYDMIVHLYGEEERIDIAPGCKAPVLVLTNAGYQMREMDWGFKAITGKLVINARIETLMDRPMFSRIADTQRCIIPASGYYEWRSGDRQKFSLMPADGKGLAYIAGLYRFEEDGWRFTVITRDASKEVFSIHDRMPLMLTDRNEAKRWLMGENTDVFSRTDILLTISAEGNEQITMEF